MIGAELSRHSWLGRGMVGAFLSWILWVNIPKYDLKSNSWSVEDMEQYAFQLESIVSSSSPYTIISLNFYNDLYAMNYRYYLSVFGWPPLESDNVNQASTLIIINETLTPVQEILDLPLYEIVSFPEKGKHEVINFEYGPQVIVLRR